MNLSQETVPQRSEARPIGGSCRAGRGGLKLEGGLKQPPAEEAGPKERRPVGKTSEGTAAAAPESILITGASSGIGEAMAFWFAANRPGACLILTGRNRARLAATALQLEQKGAATVFFCAVDLVEKEAAEQLLAAVSAAGLSLSVLINNAGANEAGLFEELTPGSLRSLLRLNMEAGTLLARLFLPDLLANRGRLLWVSSTGAFQPGPYTAVYYAAKAYTQSLAEAMYLELKGRVQVSTLCPGTVHSAFSRRAGKADLASGLTPDFVANYSLPRFFKGKKRIVPGFKNRLAIFCSGLLPAGLLARTVARIQGPLLRHRREQSAANESD